MPVKTPVRLPRNDVGSIPACSNVSHTVSNITRCCGSIANASRGEIPKNPASKPPTPSKNPPHRVYDVPGEPAGSKRRPTSHPRSPGKPPIASTPPDTRPHNPSADPTPPGN